MIGQLRIIGAAAALSGNHADPVVAITDAREYLSELAWPASGTAELTGL